MRTLKILTATALLFSAAPAYAVDNDSDGVDDSIDNCVQCYNPSQTDTTQNGVGDYCDMPPPPPPTCDDGELNQDETGVDCGGAICDACPIPTCSGDPLRYDHGAIYSPLNCLVIDNLESIIASSVRDDSMIMRAGDSHSVSTNHLSCYTHPFFDGFQRIGLSVAGGQTANWASGGPFANEMAATDARFALIMFGTNDLWYGGGPNNPYLKYQWFYNGMVLMIKDAIAAGVVPVLSTIPPHEGTSTWFGPLVGGINAIVFGLGQEYAVPVVNLHDALLPLTDRGLLGDGIHLNRLGHALTCDFSALGLDKGHNMRNFVVTETLERIYDALFAPVPVMALDGSLAPSPGVIDGLPYAASGESHVYTFNVIGDTHVRVVALSPSSNTNVDLYGPNGEFLTGYKTIVHTLTPGTWIVSTADASEYLFTITECENAGCAP